MKVAKSRLSKRQVNYNPGGVGIIVDDPPPVYYNPDPYGYNYGYSNPGLTPRAIAGIVLSILGFLGIFTVLMIVCCSKKRKHIGPPSNTAGFLNRVLRQKKKPEDVELGARAPNTSSRWDHETVISVPPAYTPGR